MARVWNSLANGNLRLKEDIPEETGQVLSTMLTQETAQVNSSLSVNSDCETGKFQT